GSWMQPVVRLVPPAHPAPVPQAWVPVSALRGTRELAMTGPAVSWNIQAGTTLVVDTGANQETVEVLAVNENPPRIRAAFTKSHAVRAPIALANVAGAPPGFLQPLALEGPTPLSPPTHPSTIPVAGDPSRSNTETLAGDYDGIPWRIRRETQLLLDVGPAQEVVTVPATPFVVDRAAATGSFQVVMRKPHADDFLITNTLLGNP